MSTRPLWKPGWQGWQATPEAALHLFCAGDHASGPTALITAGVHGDEYEGPAAVARLSQELAATPLRGRVLLVPVANPLARLSGTRVTQQDDRNLARCFPGESGGSITERLAHAIFEHLLRTSDYLIDLHSGGVEYLFLPLAGFYGEAATDNRSYVAARIFGLPALWQLPSTPGVLSKEAISTGKVAIGHEYGGAGQLSPQGAEAYVQGVKNCLCAWSILPGASPAPSSNQHLYSGDWLQSAEMGLFLPQVELGSRVDENALLATIHDERGQAVQQIHAPFAGRVLGLRSKAHIPPHAWTVLLGRRHNLVE
jgi:predicted deacylase